MSWILKLLVSLTVSTSLVTGTTPPEKQPPQPSRMVVAVQIAKDRSPALSATDPMQIEAVLYYLRGLTPDRQAPEDPERYEGPVYTITLFSARGERQVYRQKADRWISKNSRPWRRIPKEKAAMLPQLLRVLKVSKERSLRGMQNAKCKVQSAKLTIDN
ncbi:MAG: hypothetical protein E7437_04810 [Ruminococcaceae bacterium]|nr:hypothetical protein [Oscillospiraceae bacterium]